MNDSTEPLHSAPPALHIVDTTLREGEQFSGEASDW